MALSDGNLQAFKQDRKSKAKTAQPTTREKTGDDTSIPNDSSISQRLIGIPCTLLTPTSSPVLLSSIESDPSRETIKSSLSNRPKPKQPITLDNMLMTGKETRPRLQISSNAKKKQHLKASERPRAATSFSQASFKCANSGPYTRSPFPLRSRTEARYDEQSIASDRASSLTFEEQGGCEDDLQEGVLYDVAEVIGEKHSSNKIHEFQIVWKNYDEITWIPADNCYCTDLIASYRARRDGTFADNVDLAQDRRNKQTAAYSTGVRTQIPEQLRFDKGLEPMDVDAYIQELLEPSPLPDVSEKSPHRLWENVPRTAFPTTANTGGSVLYHPISVCTSSHRDYFLRLAQKLPSGDQVKHTEEVMVAGAMSKIGPESEEESENGDLGDDNSTTCSSDYEHDFINTTFSRDQNLQHMKEPSCQVLDLRTPSPPREQGEVAVSSSQNHQYGSNNIGNTSLEALNLRVAKIEQKNGQYCKVAAPVLTKPAGPAPLDSRDPPPWRRRHDETPTKYS